MLEEDKAIINDFLKSYPSFEQLLSGEEILSSEFASQQSLVLEKLLAEQIENFGDYKPLYSGVIRFIRLAKTYMKEASFIYKKSEPNEADYTSKGSNAKYISLKWNIDTQQPIAPKFAELAWDWIENELFGDDEKMALKEKTGEQFKGGFAVSSITSMSFIALCDLILNTLKFKDELYKDSVLFLDDNNNFQYITNEEDIKIIKNRIEQAKDNSLYLEKFVKDDLSTASFNSYSSKQFDLEELNAAMNEINSIYDDEAFTSEDMIRNVLKYILDFGPAESVLGNINYIFELDKGIAGYIGYHIERWLLDNDEWKFDGHIFIKKPDFRLSYCDNDIIYGKKYRYRIQAVYKSTYTLNIQKNLDIISFGNWSDFEEVETIDLVVPPEPCDFKLIPKSQFGKMHLLWNLVIKSQEDISHYKVYRKEVSKLEDVKNANWMVVANKLKQTFFVDDDVKSSIIYVYGITTVDKHGNESVMSMQLGAQLNRYIYKDKKELLIYFIEHSGNAEYSEKLLQQVYVPSNTFKFSVSPMLDENAAYKSGDNYELPFVIHNIDTGNQLYNGNVRFNIKALEQE